MLGDLEHVLKASGERPASAARQSQRPRPLGVSEVIHVAPIVRRGASARGRGEVGIRGGHLTRAGRAGDEDVIAMIANPETEPQGRRREWLTDDPLDGEGIIGRVNRERCRVAGSTQEIRCHLGEHGFLRCL
ncbi:MAG: hypothetical protein ACRDIY_13440 [Chloroflexota bacterium]